MAFFFPRNQLLFLSSDEKDKREREETEDRQTERERNRQREMGTEKWAGLANGENVCMEARGGGERERGRF